ncbi:MAG: hydrogenase maturation peptidase HycI [Candidatus Bathyarchaeia archaeon]
MGIGNPLKGDDALGLKILRKIRGKVPRSVKVIEGGIAPENFIGKIGKLRPSHVLLIDAALFGGKPGEAKMISIENIPSVTISTHMVPLYMVAGLIKEKTGAKTVLLGIQPKNLNLGGEISQEIKESIEKIAKTIIEAINRVEKR